MSSLIWYRVAVSAEQQTGRHVAVMCREFADAVAAAGSPPDACMFGTNGADESEADDAEGSGGDNGATESVFFSPASVSVIPHLIARYGATPSAAPLRRHAVLLVGEESNWGLLPRTAH